MRMHPAVYFGLGVLSVYAYHKLMKPIPSNAGSSY
jgi:hypothetical protein